MIGYLLLFFLHLLTDTQKILEKPFMGNPLCNPALAAPGKGGCRFKEKSGCPLGSVTLFLSEGISEWKAAANAEG